jgi:hypothetical protein
VRKALLVGAATWLTVTGLARAQQASLFTGSFTNTQIQYTTVVDKAPLMAPIPNQAPQPGFFDRILAGIAQVFHPTVGANPIASVSTAPRLTSPVTQSTFIPSAPFYNNR